MFRFITRRDYNLMHRANNWAAPRWVRRWSMAATRAGDGWLWLAIGVAIFCFGDQDRLSALVAASIAAALSIALFKIMKQFTGRKRPCEIERHCWATLLPPDQFSFPSGHTMTAFAVAIALSLFYPTLSAALLVCALCIAASRILLGMHFLSDVVAGAVAGALLGYLGAVLTILA